MPLSEPQREIYTDPTRFRVLVSGRRFGKAFSNSSKVLTAKGFTTYADIKVGDQVYTEQGVLTDVIGVHPQGLKQIYRVHFSDSTYADVCEDHLWTTWTHRDRKQYFRNGYEAYPPKDWASFVGEGRFNTFGPKTRTTKELLETLKVGKHRDNNHSIPLTEPLEMPYVPLPVDPYLYGLWLGNGASGKGVLICNENDSQHYIDSIIKAGFKIGVSYKHKESKSFRVSALALYPILKKHGMETKDIPSQYLYSSIDQRKALLAGLLDSDGHVDAKSNIEFCSMREDHANAVIWLARSLGQKPVLYKGEAKIANKNYGTKYRVCWRQNKKFNPFRLERKARNIQYAKYSPSCEHRMIVDIVTTDRYEDCTCISVSSPNKLFLAGEELIPTHNSVLILNELIRAAQTGSDLDVYYVAPYLKMAKGIMWKMLKQAIPPANIAEKNEQELRITLKGYNSTIHLHGADNIDSLRGISISFLAVDEIQDVPIELIDTVLRPAMGDQMADGLYCGTPKGKGENTAYKLYMRGKTKPDWKSWIFTTANGGNVPQEEIDAAKAVMSPKQFSQEYEASFITMLGRVYYAFSVDENVSADVKDNGSTIHVGMDFNVSKMCACVGNIVDGKLHIFDEIVLIDSNTREMCNEINSRYPNRDIIVYPDPAGKSRSTKSDSGTTDHSIIKNEFKYQLLAKNSHPKIADRVNNVNSMLLSASGERRLLINPKCTEVINCLDGQAYKEGTSLPDKESGLDHMCDSLGYLVDYRFNLVKREVKKLELDWSY